MFSTDRNSIRQVFQQAWRKRLAGEPLQAMEEMLAEVIGEHPEYHKVLEGEAALRKDYLPEAGETNPFLHMGMHISLREQLGADRPPGIRDLYQQLATQAGDAHQAEHQMMECLGLSLWEAQRNGGMPNEQAYLQCLRKLLKKTN